MHIIIIIALIVTIYSYTVEWKGEQFHAPPDAESHSLKVKEPFCRKYINCPLLHPQLHQHFGNDHTQHLALTTNKNSSAHNCLVLERNTPITEDKGKYNSNMSNYSNTTAPTITVQLLSTNHLNNTNKTQQVSAMESELKQLSPMTRPTAICFRDSIYPPLNIYAAAWFQHTTANINDRVSKRLEINVS